MSAMSLTDQAQSVRPDEQLDEKALARFLAGCLPELTLPLIVKQFPSGFSNLTYLLQSGGREFVLRRPPHGTKAQTAHDMKREYDVLSALRPHFPYGPRPLCYCADLAVLGAPFYVMERIPGIILRRNLPTDLELSPEDCRRLCTHLLDVLVALHGVDFRAAGLGDFGKPEGYVRRQVQGWSGRYRKARTDDAPDFETVMQWLADRTPPDSDQSTLVHNDYKFDNIVLDAQAPLKIIGVLDWEMATIGDPLMDLGNTLAYWVQADDPEEMRQLRLMPTHLPGMLTRRELVQYYGRQTGRKVDDFDFYFAFGLFRLAVIAQQIYYRFYHGQTKNERFQMLIFAVHMLEKVARRVISEGFF
jgi:aminoglycoside phosphotransferase (APT) family kinase protein